MAPRIVITGIGVVSPFGVGRERFWEHVSGGCSGTRAITEFDASDFACRVAAPVTGVTIDDVPALDGDDLWDPGYRADPKRYSRAALIGVIAAREAWADAGLRIARAERRRRHRQRRRRHRRRRAAVLRLLRRARQEGHAVRDSGVDRRHGVERDFDLAAAARHQPRAVVRLHELDRRDRLRRGAAARRRGRRDPVGRHRCVRDARDDLRLLADEGRVDGLQRAAGRSVAAVRQGARRVRARRRRVDAGARARGSRARARRDDLRVDRRLRLDLRRLPPRADGARRRGDRPRDLARDRAVRTPAARRSATSTITARRRSSTTPSSRGACARCSATTPSGCRDRRSSR